MPVKGSWDVTEQAMESQGGGTFLRLEGDGDKAVVAFCGPPLPRERCFNENTKQYEPWDAAAQAAGRKKQTKYAMCVFVVTLKGKPLNEMRVCDMNFATMQAVIGLRDKYGFGKCLFEIIRHGAANDTKTTYNVLPDADITPEQSALFGRPIPGDRNGWHEGTVPLIDLEEVTAKDSGGGDTAVTDDVKAKPKADAKPKETKPATAPAPANGTTAHAAPAPAHAPAANGNATPANVALISKEAAAVIIERLKPLDRDKGLTPFLAAFPYIRKVSELHASDEVAAVTLANKLAAPAPAEDPFG